MRPSGRDADQMRVVRFTPDFTRHAEGSVLAEFGDTRVLCTASIENRVPPWLRGGGSGWVTGEYGMLPRSTNTRMSREATRGKQGGRTLEIQRLIGRSLRAITDLEALGERTVTLDCDVIQADGGTRTASITGAWIALADAFDTWGAAGKMDTNPIIRNVAAISVGVLDGAALLDLDYPEDAAVDVDANVVMTGDGDLIEVQGTAEGEPFSRGLLDQMLDYAATGINELVTIQNVGRG